MRILPVLLCAPILFGVTFLAGCGSSDDSSKYLDADSTAIAGTSGRLTLGVNTYLWQATLDTLSPLPLVSADPFGGVIITDWYSTPAAPDERLKVTAYIMDRNLRADGIRMVVFRQTRAGGAWGDAQPNPDTAHKLEDVVLTKARELRLATLNTASK
jgi:hypothetical protein